MYGALRYCMDALRWLNMVAPLKIQCGTSLWLRSCQYGCIRKLWLCHINMVVPIAPLSNVGVHTWLRNLNMVAPMWDLYDDILNMVAPIAPLSKVGLHIWLRNLNMVAPTWDLYSDIRHRMNLDVCMVHCLIVWLHCAG
jgi:hypothetical protein